MSEQLIQQMEVLEVRASDTQRDFDNMVQSIKADSLLSDEGRQQQFEQAQGVRQREIEKLTEEGQALAVKIEQAQQKQRISRETASIERKRSVLGDSLVLDLTRRQMAAMPSEDVAQSIRDAKELHSLANDDNTGFMVELLNELGTVIALERDGEAAAFGIMQAVREGQQNPQNDLDSAASRIKGGWVGDLDRAEYRRRMADAFGVNPSFIPA